MFKNYELYKSGYEQNVYRIINIPITVKGGNAPLNYLLIICGVLGGTVVGISVNVFIGLLVLVVGLIFIYKVGSDEKEPFDAESKESFDLFPDEIIDNGIVLDKFLNSK